MALIRLLRCRIRRSRVQIRAVDTINDALQKQRGLYAEIAMARMLVWPSSS
jgi:hypothetical protein